MADYARRDYLRATRRAAESNRRLRTRRPLNGQVPGVTWVIEGEITVDRLFGEKKISIDPRGGDYPEYKRVIAVDGCLRFGSAEIQWFSDNGESPTGIVIPTQTIEGRGTNYYELPEPYVISNGTYLGEFFWPEIVSVDGADALLTLDLIIEAVPV